MRGEVVPFKQQNTTFFVIQIVVIFTFGSLVPHDSITASSFGLAIIFISPTYYMVVLAFCTG